MILKDVSFISAFHVVRKDLGLATLWVITEKQSSQKVNCHLQKQ
jgi:hypothetical protein